ncbi:MAG: undecaprenyl diphosphate synthase family protein [Clostridium sp.]|uniref:undecaprenyl diphosphate synthase family protein n=1 Tax=Clostridium sp. TaxID=1506 RepID=UPI003EE76FEA
MRLPNHIGIIPDGNRRFAESLGLTKDLGYLHGILPGLTLFKQCQNLNIKEITFYGFTLDNTKRPSKQKEAFIDACIKSVHLISKENAEILVLGNTNSKNFPKELLPFTKRKVCGTGGIKVNFLINYGWEWDLSKNLKSIYSSDISRIDLIIRWGGRRRLSGFLPIQSVYSDFYIIDDFWPNFKETHLFEALNWYNTQDVTLGG